MKKAVKPKRVAKITVVRKLFGKAPEKYSFYLTDGRRLDTVYELVDELETMNDEMFHHYVNDMDNHFANWIDHVFDDRALAEDIRYMHNRIEMQRAILKHLVRELIKERK